MEMATKGPGALFRNFFPFVQMATIPILLFMLCWLVITYFAPRNLASLLIVLSDRIMVTIFGMAWLSYLLIPAEGRRYWMPRWSRQHFVFLFYTLCISAVMMLLGQVLQTILESASGRILTYRMPLTLLVYLPADLIHAAIGLTFCALAVKQRGNPLWSLRLMGWSIFKIVVIVTAFSFLFSFVGSFLSSSIRAFSDPVDFLGLLSALPRNVANYASYAVVLGVLAFAYRRLTDWRGVRPEILERFD